MGNWVFDFQKQPNIFYLIGLELDATRWSNGLGKINTRINPKLNSGK